MIPNPTGWHSPVKCTCSIWAVRQWRSFGGRVKITRSPHYRWLFRMLWSPDGETWFGYVPLNPMPRGSSWWRVLRHSLWFEGYVREEKKR